MVKRKSCLTCKYYSMEGEEERGRTSFDFCTKKGECLPVAAFSFSDVCCTSTGSCFNMSAFSCLAEIAEACEYYKEKGEEGK